MGREGGRCQRRGRQRAASGGRRLEQSGTERGAVSVGLWFGRNLSGGVLQNQTCVILYVPEGVRNLY
jgi:hypothetical protein